MCVSEPVRKMMIALKKNLARVGVTELHSYQQTEVHVPQKAPKKTWPKRPGSAAGAARVEKYTPPAYELTTAAARWIIFRGDKMIVSYT